MFAFFSSSWCRAALLMPHFCTHDFSSFCNKHTRFICSSSSCCCWFCRYFVFFLSSFRLFLYIVSYRIVRAIFRYNIVTGTIFDMHKLVPLSLSPSLFRVLLCLSVCACMWSHFLILPFTPSVRCRSGVFYSLSFNLILCLPCCCCCDAKNIASTLSQ